MREIIALLIAVGMVFLYHWAMARWFDLKAVRWGHYLMEYGTYAFMGKTLGGRA